MADLKKNSATRPPIVTDDTPGMPPLEPYSPEELEARAYPGRPPGQVRGKVAPRTQELLDNEWPTIRGASLYDGVISPYGSIPDEGSLSRLEDHLMQEPGVRDIDTSGLTMSSANLEAQRNSAVRGALGEDY